MKNSLKLALVAALSFTTVSFGGVMDVDHGALLTKVKNFIATELRGRVAGLNAAQVEAAAKNAINDLPGTLLGFDVDTLRTGRLDGQSAALAARYLSEARQVLNKVTAFAEQPAIGLGMLEMAYGLIAGNIPSNVDNTLAKTVALARNAVNTAQGKAAIEAARQVLAQTSSIMQQLEAYKAANGSLNNYNFGQHIAQFRALADANWGVIRALIVANLPEIISILQQANAVTGSDIAEVSRAAQAQLNALGLNF